MVIRVCKSGNYTILTISQCPAWQHSTQIGATGRVRILVNSGINTFFPCLYYQGDGLFATSPVLFTHNFVVRNLYRHLCLAGNVQRLIDSNYYTITLTSDVAGINAIVLSSRFGKPHNLLRFTVSAWYINEPRRKADSPILHGFLNNRLHFLHLFFGGQAVGRTHHCLTNIIMPHQ